MDQYYKLSNNNNNQVNTFNPLFSCLDNLCTCSMGLCFPYCLFGRIYERAEFGSCFVGCCKLFSLQFIINLFFSLIIYSLEWDMFLKKELEFTEQIQICNNNNICLNDIEKLDYKTLYDNNCLITNTTNTTNTNNTTNTIDICECSKQTLIDQCHFNNELPDILTSFYLYLTILGINNLLILSCFTGLLLGNYRTRISHKYNILYNSRYNFLIHCLPCTNQCALCQEYNSIDTIEIFRSFYPVDGKFNI
jgi:hypothetical protein